MEEEKNGQDVKTNDFLTGMSKHLSASSEERKTEKIEPEKETSQWAIFLETLADFFKRTSVKVIGSLLLIFILFNFFFLRYDDFFGGCHIKIQFSLLEFNNLEIKRALGFMKNKAPKDYAKVCTYVDNVELYLPCSFSNAGCFRDEAPKQIGVYTLHRDKDNNPSLTAAVIYHETCHAMQKAEGRINGDREAECYRDTYRFLREVGIDDSQIFPEWKIYNN